ncbi:MAG: type II toxin-antitoxin system RelE/ParE family toxin [Eubacteriales bacterium]|nr:type II toxin-antitoxin system RelE/ParE family toxin [Eubacteriales bacterium]MDD4122460.1 type II toxin-antitoxin system RelE/ParE family toxin [Eubacteriales bacterium]MDD4630489.1 type II toxin-antitoxin system RelE/ParE family toxin [Eubacteriales bacterium]
MAAEVRLLPPARNFIKKIKDKRLKAAFYEALAKIRDDYTVGDLKSGDLTGIYGYDIYYNKTNYEISYSIIYEGNTIIVVIMAGTRENFYQQLKRYLKNE